MNKMYSDLLSIVSASALLITSIVCINKLVRALMGYAVNSSTGIIIIMAGVGIATAIAEKITLSLGKN